MRAYKRLFLCHEKNMYRYGADTTVDGKKHRNIENCKGDMREQISPPFPNMQQQINK